MKTRLLIIIASAVITSFIAGWMIGISTFYYTDDPNYISERSYVFPSKTTLSEFESQELNCLQLYKDIMEMSRTPEMQLAERETIELHKNLVLEYVENGCPDFNDLELIYNNYKQNTPQPEGECDPGPVLDDGYCYKDGKKIEFANENPFFDDNQILTVVGDAPCAWMSLHQIPHNELLQRHDRTGANALLLQIDDNDINKVSHLKEMFVALENKTGFQQNEYEENAWVKQINSSETEQQKIWNWLKDTFDSQYGKRSDDSFTSYFTYKEKFYQITWGLC